MVFESGIEVLSIELKLCDTYSPEVNLDVVILWKLIDFEGNCDHAGIELAAWQVER